MAANPARNITEATIKELFGLSGNTCANPDCLCLLIKDETIIGEICHIEAASEKGERYNPNMTDDERRSYNNLILLCSNCHKITNNVAKYTVEVLKTMKQKHENLFRNNRFLPSPREEEKILSRFAYDVSFTDIEEWGILEEIIKFVNENSPKINPTAEQVAEGKDLTRIKEKVRLNFPEEQRGYFSSMYVSTTAKQQTVKSFLENTSADDSVKVDELTEYIVTKYRDIKNSSISDVPVGEMKIIDDLAYQIIPVAKRNHPGYLATAKAIVLQSFEFCNIGQKTNYERSQTISLF